MTPQFSFYDWVQHAASTRELLLRRLDDVRRRIEPRANGQFTAGVRAMLHWCNTSERLTLERHPGARVFAGFERMSRVRPVLKHYRQLAESAEQLVLFAELDVPAPVSATVVDVTGCALAREWFLVIAAPNYKALLAARDLDGFGPTGPLQGRRFAGLTVHDGPLVTEAMRELSRQAQL